MYARCIILPDGSLAHITFRCHNRSFFFAPPKVKDRILWLLAKYKRKYGIEIFDFIIMDNHVHLLCRARSVEAMGDFFRTVNSQITRYINFVFQRDSQAIRERYKSRLVIDKKYALGLIQYIWMNRFRVTGLRPDQDPYCSAYWRLYKPYKVREPDGTPETTKNNLLATLLDHYDKLGFPSGGKEERNFVRDLIFNAIVNLRKLDKSVYEHAHTIGDETVVAFRTQLIAAYRRTNGPPKYPP